ncbi:hypothetical protein [Bacteroides eggerthii]|uniref:hypothetical protein n=1 Tax=Bacteroides eggerthii TaxID=28111 RepID=UPI0022E567AB|nr:hypothetical protein [Bacteroides eggerthii]
MEDSRETTFREIQKIVDSCIAHDYDRMTNALVLKREYLTVPQLKEYLRQEVFRVTEEIVVMRQTYHALRSIRMDMDTPDFLWESSFFEDLISDERKKYISFSCADFNMSEYLKEPTVYDESLPYLSSIIKFVTSSKYLDYLQEQEQKYTEPEPIKVVGKSNPFKSTLTPQMIKILAKGVNEVQIFTTEVTPDILSCFFSCTLDGVLKSNNTRLLAYLMAQLCLYNHITYEWQSVIANGKFILGKVKGKPLTRTDLSSANDSAKCIPPKGYEIIDKYIEQLKKG